MLSCLVSLAPKQGSSSSTNEQKGEGNENSSRIDYKKKRRENQAEHLEELKKYNGTVAKKNRSFCPSPRVQKLLFDEFLRKNDLFSQAYEEVKNKYVQVRIVDAFTSKELKIEYIRGMIILHQFGEVNLGEYFNDYLARTALTLCGYHEYDLSKKQKLKENGEKIFEILNKKIEEAVEKNLVNIDKNKVNEIFDIYYKNLNKEVKKPEEDLDAMTKWKKEMEKLKKY
ncbi:hypothetical protein ACQ4LE_001452 [Meloidogyne hapla]